MTLHEAIHARHSVRRYIEQPLSVEAVKALQEKIKEVNEKGGLNVQLILNEPKAFQGILAYGKFSGVSNYLVMIGRKSRDLNEHIGYYGEQLVLLAQQLGLNTCWAGLSYKKIPNTYELDEDEKIVCYIALGYGQTQGVQHKSKTVTEVSNATDQTPDWFRCGVEAALLAPSAINQQKFHFEYKEGNHVAAKRFFSLVGYTKIDLGIAKLHFEIGAGRDVEWD